MLEKRNEENCKLERTVSITTHEKGRRFEIKCINRLKDLGFENVEKTSESGDYGGDIVANLNGIKYLFQCKDHNKRKGVGPVQEVYAAKNLYNANVCVAISSLGFTAQAYNLAKTDFVLLLAAEDFFNSESIDKILKDAITTLGNADVTTHDYDIITEFREIKSKVGHTPTLPELSKTLRYIIRKTYGTYTNFLVSIGETTKRSRPTIWREIVKKEYIRIRTLLAKTPTANEIRLHTNLPYNQFHQYPLTKLQKECGDIPNCDRSFTKDDLIKGYLELEKHLGHKPNGVEIDKYGKYGSHLYRRSFGSLKAFYSLPEISAKKLLKVPLTKKEIIAFYLMLKIIFDRQQIPLTYGNIRKLSCGEYKPFPISAIEYKYKNFKEFCQLLEDNESVKDLEVNLNKLILSFTLNS